MLVISRDGKRGYTSNVGAGSVSVLDLPGRKTVAIIPISSESQRIAISNDDKMVFTSDQTKPQLAVIDTGTNKIKTWVPLPAVGYGTSPTRDGRFLLVAMPKANQLAVVDLGTLKVVRTIDVPEDPVLADALLGGPRVLDRVAPAGVQQPVEASARALGEVLTIHEHDVIAAQRRVPSDSRAGRATADHEDLGVERHHPIRLPPPASRV